MNIIVYDDEVMKYFKGHLKDFDVICNHEIHRSIDGKMYCGNSISEYTFVANEVCESETIKLDDTMMKRIAKYNKEKEVMEIEEKILDKKAELEKLTDLIEDREKRVEKLKEFIANLYELDLEEDYDDCWED